MQGGRYCQIPPASQHMGKHFESRCFSPLCTVAHSSSELCIPGQGFSILLPLSGSKAFLSLSFIILLRIAPVLGCCSLYLYCTVTFYLCQQFFSFFYIFFKNYNILSQVSVLFLPNAPKYTPCCKSMFKTSA